MPKVPPTTQADIVEDVEVEGPMTGNAALNQVLEGIKPEAVESLYPSRGVGPADRMNAAVKLQGIVGELNDIASRYGLSPGQHLSLLRGLGDGAETPLGLATQAAEARVPESLPPGPPMEEAEGGISEAACDVPIEGGDIMDRAAAAKRMKGRGAPPIL